MTARGNWVKGVPPQTESARGRSVDRNTEDRMAFRDEKNVDRNNLVETDYDDDCDKAAKARNTQREDTDPCIEKEGFLGMDDLDRLRRRHIEKVY